MTVIAWDGKTLAADRRSTNSGLYRSTTKIFRAGNALVGFCGDESWCRAVLNWVIAGRDAAKYPPREKDDFSICICIDRAGRIEQFEGRPSPAIIEERQHAVGSGRDFALAAMHLGCDAARAVAVASEFEIHCGNGVDTLTFDDPAP